MLIFNYKICSHAFKAKLPLGSMYYIRKKIQKFSNNLFLGILYSSHKNLNISFTKSLLLDTLCNPVKCDETHFAKSLATFYPLHCLTRILRLVFSKSFAKLREIKPIARNSYSSIDSTPSMLGGYIAKTPEIFNSKRPCRIFRIHEMK